MEWEYIRRLLALIAMILNMVRLLTYSTVATWVKKRLKSASVSMPWNIPPALLVLWSVVWMFARPPGPEQYVPASDDLERNALLDSFHLDLNFGPYQPQGAAEPLLTGWDPDLDHEVEAWLPSLTTDRLLMLMDLDSDPVEDQGPASPTTLRTVNSPRSPSSQPSISPFSGRQIVAAASPQTQAISSVNSAEVVPPQTEAISSVNSAAGKAFSCPRCGTLFTRRDNMNRHAKKCPTRRVSTAAITGAAPQNGATKRRPRDVSQGPDEEYDGRKGAEFAMSRKRCKAPEEDLAGMKEKLRKAEETVVRAEEDLAGMKEKLRKAEETVVSAEERSRKMEEYMAEMKERLKKAEERVDLLLRK